VEFVVYDDQSQPPTAVCLYEKLITQDKVDAVMGSYSSATERPGPSRARRSGKPSSHLTR
jgi:branched-chain amino acid transport system substrate-binding protein